MEREYSLELGLWVKSAFAIYSIISSKYVREPLSLHLLSGASWESLFGLWRWKIKQYLQILQL